MSKLIVNPADSPIQPAFDKYWDSPMTRREAKVLFNKLAFNDSELMGMADTAAIVINFLCEKLGIKKEDIQGYVNRKMDELKAMRDTMKAEAEAAERGENPNSVVKNDGQEPPQNPQGQAPDAQPNV